MSIWSVFTKKKPFEEAFFQGIGHEGKFERYNYVNIGIHGIILFIGGTYVTESWESESPEPSYYTYGNQAICFYVKSEKTFYPNTYFVELPLPNGSDSMNTANTFQFPSLQKF